MILISISLTTNGALQVALVIKNPPASVGDLRDAGSIPGLGRSPGGGHVFLLGERIPWTEEPSRLQSVGTQTQPKRLNTQTHKLNDVEQLFCAESTVFFGKVSFHILCPCFNEVATFLLLSFESSFYPRYKSFIRCVLQRFPPSRWLVFFSSQYLSKSRT